MKRLKFFLPILAVLAFVGAALAGSVSDPCSVYPHQSANIPAQTATVAVVPSITGKQIYICSIEVAQLAGGTTSATPGLSIWYGTTFSSTPCATSSPVAVTQLGTFGGQGTTTYGGDGSHTILGPIPSGAGVCGLEAAAGTIYQGGSISYVQIVP